MLESKDNSLIKIQPKVVAPLDPAFCPASLWENAYEAKARSTKGSRKVTLAVERPDGECWSYTTRFLPDEVDYHTANGKRADRLVKFLLWAWGGNRIHIDGAPELVAPLREAYQPGGERAFDANFMGTTCFLEDLHIDGTAATLPSGRESKSGAFGRNLEGCRIGFDLGGSDRKCAALIDGEVVFSEEIKWNPYFEKDPAYHRKGIQDSLERAARHLPRVDAIGGSAAGIYVNNQVRAGSLYRGISSSDFDASIRNLFLDLQKEWGGIPLAVANDGDVTALAASITLNANAILGIAMGTSQAAGFIDSDGHIIGYLNELAFAPIDYREGAPLDEWSGDGGCGAQYFSQQAVGRLLPASGLENVPDVALPEQLEFVQQKMKGGDERAASIYHTIGVYYGYALAHYARFYEFENVLTLGRVISGEGGDIILKNAQAVLETEFPLLAERLHFLTPDEKMKRHGQAIAAASLPSIP